MTNASVLSKKKLPWTEMMQQLLSILSCFAHPRGLKDFSVLFISTPRSFEKILYQVFVIKFELFCKFYKRNNLYKSTCAKGNTQNIHFKLWFAWRTLSNRNVRKIKSRPPFIIFLSNHNKEINLITW